MRPSILFMIVVTSGEGKIRSETVYITKSVMFYILLKKLKNYVLKCQYLIKLGGVCISVCYVAPSLYVWSSLNKQSLEECFKIYFSILSEIKCPIRGHWN